MTMEISLLKRAAPYIEVACFCAAWAVGLALATTDPRQPIAPRERDMVANDSAPTAVEVQRHRTFRPIAIEEIEEGG